MVPHITVLIIIVQNHWKLAKKLGFQNVFVIVYPTFMIIIKR